jgi:hypothetical protein
MIELPSVGHTFFAPTGPNHRSSATAPKPSYTEFQPGKIMHRTSTSPNPEDFDIRQHSHLARKDLLHGPLVSIMVSGYQIGTIPLSLLTATSMRFPGLLIAGAINLSADTDYDGVMILVQHLIDVCRSKAAQPARLRNNMPVYQSLAVCQAAFRLGMTKYTCHVFRRMEACISNTLLRYDEIDAVCHFGASHPRLYNRMVDRLAVMVREETIPNPGVFAQFCFARPVLNTSIVATVAWQDEKQPQAQRKSEPAACQKQQQERRAKEKKRSAHESAMRQACLAKTRATGKDRVMNVEEKEWYVKAYGKQPPRGC